MTFVGYVAMVPLVASLYVTPEVNMDYSGEVNPFNGAPIEESQSAQTQLVKLPDGSTYDRDAHTFAYTVSDYQEDVTCTVANGMATTGTVSIVIPDDMAAKLYSFGKEVTDVDYSNIDTPGSYSLVVTGVESEKQVLYFDIVNDKTGRLTSYTLPNGFSIVSVSIDDVTQAPNYSRIIDMQKEGRYEISYKCTATGITYNLNVEVDHTPPDVQFEGVSGSIARGPVKIVGLQDEDTVKVIFNGESVSAPSNGVIGTVGKYTVTVFDDAENSVTKEFTIRMYLNIQGGIFIALAVILIVAAGVYMYVSRKKLRVR